MNGRPYTAVELEHYLAGNLDDQRRAAIDAAAEEDADLMAWIDERKAEREAFLLDPRRKPFAKLVEEAGANEKRSWFSSWIPGLSMAAAMAVAAVVFLNVAPTEQRRHGIRIKGSGLSIQAAVLQGDSPQMFDGSKPLAPGDRLRLELNATPGGYVTVLLEEQDGGVSVLYRAEEIGKVSSGALRLPGSLELDEELGRERIYVLVSDTPPDVDVWLGEIRTARDKAGFEHGWLPAGQTRVSTMEYEKAK